MARKLIDEIDRLFAELIHDPWRRGAQRVLAGPAASSAAPFEIEVPVQGIMSGDVSVALEGDHLTVAVLRHAATRSAQGADVQVAASRQQAFQRSIRVPSGARLSGVDVSYDRDGMHVRVRLEK
jgi:HSP20 family molecular chaperone IbpA